MVILAAVGEKHSSDRIIETGYELAEAFQDELQVVHVIPKEDAEAHFELLRDIPEFSDFSFAVEVDRAADVASELIDKALDAYNSQLVTPVGRVGEPAEEILTLVNSKEPSYVVIGGRKRSPVGKALFGSVTQSVILNSDQPVVTVITNS